jgi:hypothetical protein
MATTYKILGRAVGAPAAPNTVYTVPTGKYAVISTFTLTNDSASSNSFSVYITGGTLGAVTLIYGITIPGGSRMSFSWGLALSAGEALKVNGGNTCTLVAFGSEVDI